MNWKNYFFLFKDWVLPTSGNKSVGNNARRRLECNCSKRVLEDQQGVHRRHLRYILLYPRWFAEHIRFSLFSLIRFYIERFFCAVVVVVVVVAGPELQPMIHQVSFVGRAFYSIYVYTLAPKHYMIGISWENIYWLVACNGGRHRLPLATRKKKIDFSTTCRTIAHIHQ